MTTCGTPTGYTNGCHGAAECANHATGRMTCTEAHVRYAGDYAYRKQVDNGTATDEREQFVKDKRKTTRLILETQAEANQRRQPTKRPTVRRPGVKPRPKAKHGTNSGYKIFGPKHDCPEETTCRQAANLHRKLYEQARRAA